MELLSSIKKKKKKWFNENMFQMFNLDVYSSQFKFIIKILKTFYAVSKKSTLSIVQIRSINQYKIHPSF